MHSEANWRGRLFNLAQKKNVTYQDILYFLTFFNNNAEPEDECDYRLLQAIGSIINSNEETCENQVSIIESVYDNLYPNEKDEGSAKGDYNACDILGKLSEPDIILNGEQREAFQLCIEFLLKDDWDKQMNKK